MSKMADMKTPRNRREFERNFNLLTEKMYQGKVNFGPDVTHTITSLRKVHRLPNGRIDLLTINESARLQANMISNFDNEISTELLSKGNKTDTHK